MTPFALKFVREDKIDEHLALGWVGAKPNAPHHHLEYGIEMKWICRCPVPGGFKYDNYASEYRRQTAFHETKTTESANDRTRTGAQ